MSDNNFLTIFSGWVDEVPTLIYMPLFINKIIIIGSFYHYYNPTHPPEIVYNGPIIDEINVVPSDSLIELEHKMFYKYTVDNKFKVFEIDAMRTKTERSMIMILGIL